MKMVIPSFDAERLIEIDTRKRSEPNHLVIFLLFCLILISLTVGNNSETNKSTSCWVDRKSNYKCDKMYNKIWNMMNLYSKSCWFGSKLFWELDYKVIFKPWNEMNESQMLGLNKYIPNSQHHISTALGSITYQIKVGN